MRPSPVVRFASAIPLVLVLLSVAPAQEPTKAKAGKLIDLNTATVEQLLELPGVGDATAKKIVDGRPYATMDDLKGAGVPERTIEKLRPVATVGKAAATPTTRKPAAARTTEKMEKAEAVKEAKEAAAEGERVDLNTANAAKLEELPGVGPALAKAIIAGRPYTSVDGLKEVKGMGPAKLAAVKDRVKVGAAAPAPVVTEPASPTTTTTTSTTPKSKTATTTPKAKAKAATGLAPGQKININTASKDELDRLPGIGPVRAQAIIDKRPFTTIEDIKGVKGIKDVEFGKIQDMITVK